MFLLVIREKILMLQTGFVGHLMRRVSVILSTDKELEVEWSFLLSWQKQSKNL